MAAEVGAGEDRATTAAPEKVWERISLPITGMNCAACAARIEKVLRAAPGVEHANVNFATHRATVEYDPSVIGSSDLAQAVREAGYGVRELPSAGGGAAGADVEQRAREEEYRGILRRFTVAALLSWPILLAAMGEMLGLLLPAWLRSPYLQLVLATPVLFYAGGPFF